MASEFHTFAFKDNAQILEPGVRKVLPLGSLEDVLISGYVGGCMGYAGLQVLISQFYGSTILGVAWAGITCSVRIAP